MELIRLDHVQLAMPKGGEAKARSFYEGLLGLTETAKPDNLKGRGGCWFEAADIKIHLGVQDDFVPATKAHPAFLVTNLSVLIEKLRNAGYRIVSDEPLAGFERQYVDDPFGNRIEFMQLINSSN